MGHKKWYAVHSVSGAHIGLWPDMDMARGVRDNEYPDGTITELVEASRPCTCHPDDNPPNPCAEKYALTECVNSHASLVDEVERLREALTTFVDEYVEMVNSGDCGFWDPEKEDKVVAARKALEKPNA